MTKKIADTKKQPKGQKFDFLEGAIKSLHKKALKEADVKTKMKYLAQITRRVLHYYTETFGDFTPVAILVEKEDKVYILSKDKIKKEIAVAGLSAFMKLYPGLVPPKIIHISEINKIEKMLEKEENSNDKSPA